jgi:hypothetical protein
MTYSGIEQTNPAPRRGVIGESVSRTLGTLVRRGILLRGILIRGLLARGILTRDVSRNVLRTRRLSYGFWKALFLRIRSRSLMRRPRAGHRLAGHPKPVDHLWPGPDGRTLPGLRRVLDQLVKSGITATVSVRLDRHRLAPLWLQCRLLVGSLAAASLLLRLSWDAALVHTDEVRRVKSIYVR